MGGNISKLTDAAPASSGTSTAPPTIDEKRAALTSLQVAASRSVASASAAKGFASIPSDELTQWSKKLEEDPALQLSRLVLSQVDPVATIASRQAIIKDKQVFNLSVKGVSDTHKYPGPRVNQGSSGRCWLFATTNVIRYNVIDTLNLGDFQLSQSYLFFHDKLEKANYYLESILDLADEKFEDRLLSTLSSSPIQDGGQWDMVVNILEKYGMVPVAMYPESFSSMASAKLNAILTSRLREFAAELHGSASSLADKRARKADMMAQVYQTLCLTLGTPPDCCKPFTWEYLDLNDKFHSWTGTPTEFYKQFSARKGMKPEEAFSLVDDPRNEKSRLYTVERLGNVWGGKGIRYVNVPITDLEDAVIASIKADQPVFFGCDSGKYSEREHGIFDDKLFNLEPAYGWKLGMNKEQRLRMGDSSMTHAMVFTAVHLDQAGRPIRYRVENSWGAENGEHGWFLMSATWFREFVYQVVVPRKLAKSEWTKILDEGKPTALKRWDPMGTLA